MESKVTAPPGHWIANDGELHFAYSIPKGADPASFQPLSKIWARDANNVYCVGSKVRAADPNTFTVLNALYAKDSRNVFTMRGAMKEVEVETFTVVGSTEHSFNTTNGFAKDRRRVFHTTQGNMPYAMKNADATSFDACGPGYGRDEVSVFFQRTKLVAANPIDWEHLRGPHSISGTNVYCLGKRIRGAEARCVESLPILGTTDYWSRDATSYYRWDESRNPREYLDEFRRCFIFVGKVCNVDLTCNRNHSLPPDQSEAWTIADHAWFSVTCKELLQQPDVTVTDRPEVGKAFRFGEGLFLQCLSRLSWMNEDRIWIFRPRQDSSSVEPHLRLSSIELWWEYLSLSQLPLINDLIANANCK